MKKDFQIAFNEICRERNLPREVVFEALKSALVTAYRRNGNVPNSQQVAADIDPHTGEMTILAEKEVVESVHNPHTEVELKAALRIDPKVALGDMLMVDSTPADFGRIAAQTAKQVILQRVREAERDHLFDEFAGREGEIVNGTVQSISQGNITIGLGRTEAVLPRGQQVESERYRHHDKLRVYILEVRRTNRGPQIVVSRNHRNLLRRLLELEVPEIYNGQVDIKSIAREAGARSKVAVVALQPGVDPVGACVGMRGVRIQSIVRELNDEKIDVIEWDADPKLFIAKALSPARVSQVFLDEDPDEGRTATVVVPDDQLSLAIGREGQNARLAAKLTGWRIDIKSLTEAAQDSLNLLGGPYVDPHVAKDKALVEQVRSVLDKKAARRPITAEDYGYLSRFVAGVEGRVIAARAVEHEKVRKERLSARRRIPKEFWDMDLEELNLMVRIHNLLSENGYKTVGDVLYQLELGGHGLLAIDGFGDKALENVSKRADDLMEEVNRRKLEAGELEAEGAEAVEGATPEAAVEEPTEPTAEAMLAAEIEEAEPVAEAQTALEAEEAWEEAAAPVEALEPVSPLDDLSRPLVEVQQPGTPSTKPAPVVVRPTPSTPPAETVESDERRGKKTRKDKEIIYDEDAGKLVVKRKRKKSRHRSPWGDTEFDDNFPEY